MLVYANRVLLESSQGPELVIQCVARWVGSKAKNFVNSERLAEGIVDLRLKDGLRLSSCSTPVVCGKRAFPYAFCATLRHSDNTVTGRLWVTEAGLRWDSEESPIQFSIVLKTEEISARVNAPVAVTRPKLVEQVLRACRPVGQTPGLSVKQLTCESARAYLHEVERSDRQHPIVVISAYRDGTYAVDAERLRSLLIGLADVAVIPAQEDTFALAEVAGRRMIAYGGAINVVFATRRDVEAIDTRLLRPEVIAELKASDRPVDGEILALVTHRTNLPVSWAHTSPEKVAQVKFRSQLDNLLSRQRSGGSAAETADLVNLLESADDEIKVKERELSQVRAELEQEQGKTRELAGKVEGLLHSLRGRQAGDDTGEELAEVLTPLREALNSLVWGNPSLQYAVKIVAILYPDRLVFLESALVSAEDSDRNGFRKGHKALELLLKLATDYWEALVGGHGDQKAKAVFGQSAFAAGESGCLSTEGRRRRTFEYQGRDLLMEKHIKHGVKDSAAETLRVHFEWIAGEKRIVVGHCGKHLDF